MWQIFTELESLLLVYNYMDQNPRATTVSCADIPTITNTFYGYNFVTRMDNQSDSIVEFRMNPFFKGSF